VRYDGLVRGERHESLRLFVACELPDEIRRGLGRLQDSLRREEAGRILRWVKPEAIHLTLKFLGAVPQRQVLEIEAALGRRIEPFASSVRPAQLGSFGGARVRVVWVGLEGDLAGLASLAGKVDEALEPLGFSREARPFAAHLTLGRVRDGATDAERRELRGLIAGHRMAAFEPITLSEASLMQSVLGPGGSVYRRLAAFPNPGHGTTA
jgi:2'-5' RNA ligase